MAAMFLGDYLWFCIHYSPLIIFLLLSFLLIWWHRKSNSTSTLPPSATTEPPPPPSSPLKPIAGEVVTYYHEITSGSSVVVECAICLEKLCDGEVCRVLMKCNHVYHRICIDKWLEADPTHNCPLCRGSVRRSDSTQEDDDPNYTDDRLVYMV